MSNSRDKIWENLGDLYQEEERLKTFRGWTYDFVRPEDLAGAGFFWLHDGTDSVQCIFCNGAILDWKHGDVPIDEHFKFYPYCPTFARSPSHPYPERGEDYMDGREKEDDEIPGIIYGGPWHQQFASYETRLNSFDMWENVQSPEALAAAGFYYVKLGDHVRCFYCNGGLRNWEKEDDPWVEHAKYFNSCGFLLLKKGQYFVDNIMHCDEESCKTSPSDAPLTTSIARPTTLRISSPISPPQFSKRGLIPPSTIENIMDRILCRSCNIGEVRVAVLSCGHLYCADCAVRLSFSRCWLCRKKTFGLLRIVL